MKLNGKVVLITGSGRGIGQSIALLFAQEGAKVAVNDKDDSCEQTAKAIRAAGNEAIAVKADVSKSADVQRLVNTVVDTYGKIDVLVNNAGVELHGVKTLMDTSEEQWDYTLNTNLKGYFLVSKHVAPHMIKNGGGVIVNINSVDGLYAFCNSHISYNTSMAGRNMLTKVMARQLGPYNIRVNGVCPTSTYDTGLYQITPEKEVKMKADNPLGRSAKKEEVAKLALFLASDEVPYINGELIVLDGGHTI
jgi:NAD(P)-dependent dehydrogenase (short-subunit alcohol dehydrogenase family)